MKKLIKIRSLLKLKEILLGENTTFDLQKAIPSLEMMKLKILIKTLIDIFNLEIWILLIEDIRWTRLIILFLVLEFS